jgi:glycosyltransferase involved in cell wall biosynthesis
MESLAATHPDERFLQCYRPHRLLRGLRDERPRNAAARVLLEGIQLWRASLFHGLNQRLPLRRLPRAVCTFHDLFVLTADYSTPEFRRRFAEQARQAADRADLIVAVSRFTANQVRDLLGVSESRLRVVPHGVRAIPRGPAGAVRELAVLHVGAIQHRKNIVRLVEAFERALPKPWRLVLAGSGGYGSADIHARIASSPAADRIEVKGWVTGEELRSLYRTSSMLAFPSLDEGFGIPVLEAMAAGLPVLTSNRSALPEVAGDCALLVDPVRTEEIEEGLRTLSTREDIRRDLIERGAARVREFTWERAAERTWAVYEELLQAA